MEGDFDSVISNSKDYKTSFSEDGFVVLKDFIEVQEISVVRNEVEKIIVLGSETSCVRPNNTLLPLRWNDLIVGYFLESDGRIEMLKKAVEAKDLKWISGYVSIKDANSPPLWWHQDWWCWQHEISFKKVTSQIAVMCYLNATNEHNGALRVLPGSHLKETKLHSYLPEAHAETTNQIELRHRSMESQPEQVTLNLNAGDAVVIDYRLLHGTHQNASPERRDCIMLTFTPSWQMLPEDIKGHLINHQALPGGDEIVGSTTYPKDLLPTFHGIRKDLRINRFTPLNFRTA